MRIPFWLLLICMAAVPGFAQQVGQKEVRMQVGLIGGVVSGPGFLGEVVVGEWLGEQWFLSTGLGFYEYEDLYTLPAHLKAIYRIFPQRHIELDFSAGYAPAFKKQNQFDQVNGGIFLSPMVSFRVLKNPRLNLKAGYKIQRATLTESEVGRIIYSREERTMYRLTFTLEMPVAFNLDK